MKSKIIHLMLIGSFLAGMPRLLLSAGPAPSLLAMSAPDALPSPALPGADEGAQLKQLGAQVPSLLQQSAGERVLVIEDRHDRHWGYWGPRRRNGVIIACIVLTAIVVTLIVVGAQPRPR
jgi:hypothetical protein